MFCREIKIRFLQKYSFVARQNTKLKLTASIFLAKNSNYSISEHSNDLHIRMTDRHPSTLDSNGNIVFSIGNDLLGPFNFTYVNTKKRPTIQISVSYGLV